MGLLTSALQIGRSALLTYQSALQITGDNVANASTPGYNRRTPILTPLSGIPLAGGIQIGAGVALTNIRRNVDEQVELRFRTAIADKEQTAVEQRTLGRLEAALNELSDTDLSTYLDQFFNSFSQLQLNPADLSLRDIVLINADALTVALHRQATDLSLIHEELNDKLGAFSTQASKLAEDVARLNGEILTAEAGSGSEAAGLRDQRDVVLRDLSELIEIRAIAQDNGAVNVFIGNEPLVELLHARALTTTEQTIDDHRIVTVRFADNLSAPRLDGGSIAGAVEARDTHVARQRDKLDLLTRGLIEEVNRLHASGQGTARFTDVTGTFRVLDATAALNTTAAGLDLLPDHGSFLITVYDLQGQPTEMQINIDLDGVGADTTLTTLVAAINAHPDNGGAITASITSNNQLRLVASPGAEFTFKEDSSSTLAALGVNTFFQGRSTADIAVNSVLRTDRRFLAAATSNLPGDGTNAARIAALGETTGAAALSGVTIMDFYRNLVAETAVAGAAARSATEAADVIFAALTAQRESVSGVSLDEEAINLLRYQRAFQASARYVQMVDRLIGELLALVR